MNIALLGTNLLVFELLIRRFTRSSVLAPVAGAFLLLFGPAIEFHTNFLTFHAAALSEPFFIFVFLVGILLVDKYLSAPSTALLAAICLCVAAAPLIRYVGIALIPAAVLVLFLWSPVSRRQRIKVSLIVSASGIFPSLLWSLWSADVMHGGSARTLAWHPESRIVQSILDIVSGWFLPSALTTDTRSLIFLAGLCLLGVLLTRLWRRSPGEKETVRRVLALLMFAGSYLIVVVITRDFLDAVLSTSNRILLPLIPLTYLITITTLFNYFRRSTRGLLVVSLLCVLAAAGTFSSTISFVKDPPRPGGNASTWQVMHAIEKLPIGTLIASAIPDIIYTATDRPSIGVPVFVESLNGRPNLRFSSQLEQLATILVDRHGVIVVVPQAESDWTAGSAWPANFKPYAHLQLIRAFPHHGAMYRLTPLAQDRMPSASAHSEVAH